MLLVGLLFTTMAARRRAQLPEEEDVALLKLGHDFNNARCLLNSEVAILLEHRKERDRETEMKPMFIKTLDYVEKFSRYKNKSNVNEIREMLEKFELKSYEIASLANLAPESVEEAVSLIPSLQSYSNDELQEVINSLTSFKRFE